LPSSHQEAVRLAAHIEKISCRRSPTWTKCPRTVTASKPGTFDGLTSQCPLCIDRPCHTSQLASKKAMKRSSYFPLRTDRQVVLDCSSHASWFRPSGKVRSKLSLPFVLSMASYMLHAPMFQSGPCIVRRRQRERKSVRGALCPCTNWWPDWLRERIDTCSRTSRIEVVAGLEARWPQSRRLGAVDPS